MSAPTAVPTTAAGPGTGTGRLTFERLVRRFPGDIVACIRAQQGGFLISLDSRYRVIELNHAAEEALGLHAGDPARGDFTGQPLPSLRERRPARLVTESVTIDGALLGVPGGAVFVGDRRSCRRTIGPGDVAGHWMQGGDDPLTGLPDAVTLRVHAAQVALDADAGDLPIALLLVALDKAHPSDQDIRLLATTVCGTLRADDVVARMADGVLGVLVDVDRHGAAVVAGRLQLAMAAAGGTVSVGIAIREPFQPLDLAVERATAALKAARALGADRVSLG